MPILKPSCYCVTVLLCVLAYNGTISHSASTGQRTCLNPASNPDVKYGRIAGTRNE